MLWRQEVQKAVCQSRISRAMLRELGKPYKGSASDSDFQVTTHFLSSSAGAVCACKDDAVRWWIASESSCDIESCIMAVVFFAWMFLMCTFSAFIDYFRGAASATPIMIFIVTPLLIAAVVFYCFRSGRLRWNYEVPRFCFEIKDDVLIRYYFERPYVDDLAPFFLGMYDPVTMDLWKDPSRKLYRKKGGKGQEAWTPPVSSLPEIKKIDLHHLQKVRKGKLLPGSAGFVLYDDSGNSLEIFLKCTYTKNGRGIVRHMVPDILKSYLDENKGTFES